MITLTNPALYCKTRYILNRKRTRNPGVDLLNDNDCLKALLHIFCMSFCYQSKIIPDIYRLLYDSKYGKI